jgi:hypothetical protein
VLEQVWSCLARDELPVVEVRPAVPLACALPVARLAVAAVAAQLLAAQRLDAGTDRPLVLDGPHVAAAFTSERHYRRVDGAGAVGFAPLSRFHRTAAGWLRLHANYPHHRRAVHEALGADPTDRLQELAAGEAEDLVVAAGGVAAAVRSAAQWGEHPQGAAVAALPLLSLTQVAPAAPRRPRLAGLRVLDLTRVIAGPVCTRTLASHGADVLRVDSPALPEDLDTLLETGSGKRRVLLDLREAADRRRFEELLGAADVLVQGYRPASLHRFGLAPQELAERHPHLVLADVSAWGRTGPWATRRGFDSIVQAASGIASTLAAADGTPGVLPAQALDHGAGHLLAATVLTALRRQRDGGVWRAEVSLARLAHWLLSDAPVEKDAEPASAPAVDVPLLRLSTSYGAVDVVPPVHSPPWQAGLQELTAWDSPWPARPA